MSVFSHKDFDQHEQVSFFSCSKTGLKSIIAVHNTTLGPALGGCRMWAYETDEQALRDVLRLSRGMTYKSAISGLPLGGGKSVIIGDSRKNKTADLMREMGRAVETFNGKYVVAEDVGTNVDDMLNISQSTKHVMGLPGAGHGNGDPSPTTAYGVYVGLKSAARKALGKNDIAGLTVAVQGLGNVGYNLCKLLKQDGANLIVTDMQQDRVEQAVNEFGAKAVALSDIYGVQADIFAPCALGAIINDETIKQLKVKAVAGGANNQLAEMRHADVLQEKGILYTPDYVINAGGIITVYYEYLAKTNGNVYNRDQVMEHVGKIDATTEMIFKKAEQDKISTAVAADRLAESFFKAKPACKAA